MRMNEPRCLRCEHCRVDVDGQGKRFCELDHAGHDERELGVGEPSPEWCPLKHLEHRVRREVRMDDR